MKKSPKNTNNHINSGYITIEELEKYLQISKTTINGYSRDPRVKFPKRVKLGNKALFEKSAIEKWLGNNCIIPSYIVGNHDIIFKNKSDNKDSSEKLENLLTKNQLLDKFEKWKNSIKINIDIDGYRIGDFLYFSNLFMIEKNL